MAKFRKTNRSKRQRLQRVAPFANAGYHAIKKGLKLGKALYRGLRVANRFRQRGPGSRSKVIRINKRKSQTIESLGTGISNHFTKIKYKQRRLIKDFYEKITEPNYYETASTFSIIHPNTGNTNRSVIQQIVSWYSIDDVRSVYAELHKQYIGLSGTTPTAQSPINQENPVATKNQKLFLDRLNSTILIKNQENGTCIVTLYLIMAKQNENAYTTPSSDWINFIDQDTALTASGNNCDANIPFSDPRYIRQWNRKWKVVKKWNVELTAGATHREIFSLDLNRVVNTNDFQQGAGTFKNITFALMAQAIGTPVDSVQGTSMAGSSISLGFVKLIGTIHNKYVTRIGSIKDKQWYQNNSIGTGLAAQYQMDNAGDVVNALLAAQVA